jgi:hypothetical protein
VWLLIELTSQTIAGLLVQKPGIPSPRLDLKSVRLDRPPFPLYFDPSRIPLKSDRFKRNANQSESIAIIPIPRLFKTSRDDRNSSNFQQWIHELTVPQVQPPNHELFDPMTPFDQEFEQRDSYQSTAANKRPSHVTRPNPNLSNLFRHSSFPPSVALSLSSQPHLPPTNVRTFQPAWTLNPSTYAKMPNRLYRPSFHPIYSRLFRHSNRRVFRPNKSTIRDFPQASSSSSNPITGASESYMSGSEWPYSSPSGYDSYDLSEPSSSSPVMMDNMFGSELLGDSNPFGGWMSTHLLPADHLSYPALPVKVAAYPVPTAYAPVAPVVHSLQAKHNEPHHSSSSSSHHHKPHHDPYPDPHYSHHHPHDYHHHHSSHHEHHPLVRPPTHHHELPWPVVMAIALPILVAALLLPLSLLFLGNFYFLTHFVRQSLLPLLGGSSGGGGGPDDESERKAKRSKRSMDPNLIQLRWLRAHVNQRFPKFDLKPIKSSVKRRPSFIRSTAKTQGTVQPNLRPQAARTITILLNAIQRYDTI